MAVAEYSRPPGQARLPRALQTLPARYPGPCRALHRSSRYLGAHRRHIPRSKRNPSTHYPLQSPNENMGERLLLQKTIAMLLHIKDSTAIVYPKPCTTVLKTLFDNQGFKEGEHTPHSRMIAH